MSFASDVKEEVCRLQMDDSLKKAELSALIKLLSTLNFSNGNISLKIKSKNATIIKMISQNLQSLYAIKPQLQAIKEEKLKKNNTYILVVNQKSREILEDINLWDKDGLREYPKMQFLNTDNKIRAYLGGCFLATGSINSPSSTNYHLEIVTYSEKHANFIIKLMSKYYILAKATKRRNQYVVYVKASEQISDFLRLLGAYESIFTFEDVRIQRDFVNNLSRWNNCEIANDQKSLQAATMQVEAVEKLILNSKLSHLSAKDQEIALLRYENPEASLLELSKIYEEKTGQILSKSGIRHRFEKILELANKS